MTGSRLFRHHRQTLVRWLPVALLALSGACQSERATEAPALSPVLAKGQGGGGSGGGGGSTAVVVSAATPAVAARDTVIEVQIDGSGFAKGAKAKWSFAGDTTRVHVLSTSYVNSSRLKALVQVPADAPTGSYDVEVYLDGGKKGIGAELFEVVLENPDVDFYFPAGQSFGISGDDKPEYATLLNGSLYSLYHEPACGVTSNLFTGSSESSGDMVMHTNPTSTRSSNCPDYPRKLVIRYGADRGNLVDHRPVFMNVREISKPGYVIPVGSTVDRILAIQIYGKGPGCSVLRFNPNNPVGNGASLVEVTRLDARTYSVRSKPGGKAYCPDDDTSYEMSVKFIAVAARDLPLF